MRALRLMVRDFSLMFKRVFHGEKITPPFLVFSILSTVLLFFFFATPHSLGVRSADAGSFCMRGSCGVFSGWPGNENFWDTGSLFMYHSGGSKTSLWPKFPTMSKPQYCWTISQGTYCRDNVGGKVPTILKFSSSPQTVSGGTNVRLDYKVRDAWAITIKGWCSWCIGHDSESSPFITINASNFPDGCYGSGCSGDLTIPGDWHESPAYTFRLYASNGDGTVTSAGTVGDIVLYPSNNILNATGVALKNAWDTVSSGTMAFLQKIAECTSAIGGEIAAKFNDPLKIALQVGGYAATAGTNLATAGAGGGAVQVACVSAMTGAGAAVGGIAGLGIGAVPGAAIGYAIGAIGCPLAESAGWSLIDMALCSMGVRTDIIKSDNIRLVVSIGEALSKIDWSNAVNSIKNLFTKPFTVPPTGGPSWTPLVWSTNVPPGVASNTVTLVGEGSASAVANSAQIATNTALAGLNGVPVDPATLDPANKAALAVAGNADKPLIAATNKISNIQAQTLEAAGRTGEQIKNWFDGLPGGARGVLANKTPAQITCILLALDVNAPCP